LDEAKDRVGEEPVDRQSTPQNRAERQEEIQQVQTALANLGGQHSKILVLREIEGCSYETIAEILKLPVGTVRSRLFRARMQLREKLCSMRGEEASQPI
jgi:RNA polymerase sigma-70 factor (ECF subfamily)